MNTLDYSIFTIDILLIIGFRMVWLPVMQGLFSQGIAQGVHI